MALDERRVDGLAIRRPYGSDHPPGAPAVRGERSGGGVRQRVARGAAANYAATFVSLGATLFLTPFILHELGAAGYGLWVLVGSVTGYGALLDLGIGVAIVKYVAEHRARQQPEQARALVATALCLYAGLGLTVAAISAVLAPLMPGWFKLPAEQRDTAAWLVLVSGIGVGLSILCSTTTAVLRGLQRYDLAGLLTIASIAVSTPATVIVLRLGGGVIGLALVSIAVMLLMQAPSIWLIRRLAPELRFGVRGARRSLVGTIASFSWSLFVIDVAGRLQTKTDEIVIGTALPVSAVTPYAIAQGVSGVARRLTYQFMKLILPLASELHAVDDWVRLRLLYVASSRLALAIFIPIGGTIAVLARPVLTAWVGPEHARHPELVVILTVASLLDTVLWPAGFVLQGMARHRPLAPIAVGSGVANLLLSLVLVRRFGITGVALGTLIPTSVECLCFVLPYTMRTVGVSAGRAMREVFLPTMLPAVPMAATLYLLRPEASSLVGTGAVAAAGLLVYGVGFLAYGAGEIERRSCRSVALRLRHLAGS